MAKGSHGFWMSSSVKGTSSMSTAECVVKKMPSIA